jgi:hypothetical protein
MQQNIIDILTIISALLGGYKKTRSPILQKAEVLINMYQVIPKETLPYFYRYLYLTKRANNNSIVVYVLRDIVYNYQSLEQRQKSFFYFNQAASFTKSTRQYYLYKVVLVELAGAFIESKQFNKAQYTLEETKGFTMPKNLISYCICLLDLYFSTDTQIKAIDILDYYRIRLQKVLHHNIFSCNDLFPY